MGVIFFFTNVTTTTVRLPFSTSSSSSSLKISNQNPNLYLKKLNHNHNHSRSSKSSTVYAAAAEGEGREEDSKFVPINDDDPSYGPPALLLLGFQPEEEASKIQQLLKDLDGEFMRIIYCTESMISDSLWNAMHTNHHPNLQLQQLKSPLPRICILSGLTGEETLMFIDAFQESGLEAAVFAALVPNNAHTPLHELIQEIMGDHEAMSAKQYSTSP